VDERIEWGGQPSTSNESAVNEGVNCLSVVNAVARPTPRTEGVLSSGLGGMPQLRVDVLTFAMRCPSLLPATEGRTRFPVDGKCAQIVAACYLRAVPILLYRAHEFDAMPPATL
jgi:hypothetical protein